MSKIRVMFCGGAMFAVPTLKTLADHENIEIIAVVTSPDRPVGRGLKMTSPPVATFAKERNFPLIQTEDINNSVEVDKLIESGKIDAIIVLSFSHFLDERILSAAGLGAFNLHTSLLPKYRGAAPIQYAIWNGDKVTGVTIQRMVLRMDAGDIVYSREVPIEDTDTGDSLFEKMETECALAISEFVPQMVEGSIEYRAQDEYNVTFAPILNKKDGLIHFSSKRSKDVINQVRAMTSWPGTYIFLNEIRLKILEVQEQAVNLSPGDISVKDNMLVVGTRDGALRLSKVQIQGKNPYSDQDFIRGHKYLNRTEIKSYHDVVVSPSILSCNFLRLSEEIKALEDIPNIWIHLDVMDGAFVPNLTFGHNTIRSISKVSGRPLDAHLMVFNPEFYIDSFADIGLHNLTLHLEAVDDPVAVISRAKEKYPSVGISIKPNTPVSALSDEILSLVDLVLIMSVEPGFGGQKFMEGSYDKIRELNAKKKEFKFTIQVDGGVSDKNSDELIFLGADNLVAGSFVFKGGRQSYSSRVARMRLLRCH